MEVLKGRNNKILRAKSREIKKITKEIKIFAKKMIKTCKGFGIGLAAPQVGRNERIFIAKINGGFKVFINPKILEKGKEKSVKEEGCLSLPGVWGDVERIEEILISFQNVDGRKMMLKYKGFFARIIQHEIDHLDGILFVDKVVGKIRKDNIDYNAKKEAI